MNLTDKSAKINEKNTAILLKFIVRFAIKRGKAIPLAVF
jgi:hypothetical protein